MKTIVAYLVLSCATFLAVLKFRDTDGDRPRRTPAPPVDAPDSVQLAHLSYFPGKQLVAYVFGGSRCGNCQRPSLKLAIADLRDILKARYVTSMQYRAVRTVGVAINTDLREGTEYLTTIGNNAFDEISVGSGWQNEHVVRLLRQQHVAEAAVPLIILISRHMSARLSPLELTYGKDSVVAVVQGATAIEKWIRDAPTAHPDTVKDE